MPVTKESEGRLRRDAERNRRRLIQAAGELLREHGLDTPLDEIAHRAGVGNATLYRRFPTREELYEAVFAETGELLAEIADRVLADRGWLGGAGQLPGGDLRLHGHRPGALRPNDRVDAPLPGAQRDPAA